MKKRKILRIMMLAVMFYSSIFGNIQTYNQTTTSIAHATTKEERDLEVKNYNDEIYTKNEFSGRHQGEDGDDFFKKTNKELEAEHKKFFGEETPEETQKRIEETGLSNQPVLGEYRPDDNIAATMAGEKTEGEKENQPESIDPNDPRYADAIEKCVEAGNTRENCTRLAPAIAECLETQGDIAICSMLYRLDTKGAEKQEDTNGTDGILGFLGKYGGILESDQPWYGIVYDLAKEGAKDIVDWAKENPVEAALTVAMFFFPMGLAANLALKLALRGGGFLVKAGRAANLVGKLGPRAEKAVAKFHDLNTATMRKYNNLKDFFSKPEKIKDPLTGKSVDTFSRNKVKLGDGEVSAKDRVSALRNYLAKKEADGAPLSARERMLKDASEQLAKREEKTLKLRERHESLIKQAENNLKNAERNKNRIDNKVSQLESEGKKVFKGTQREQRKAEQSYQKAQESLEKARETAQREIAAAERFTGVTKGEEALSKGYKIVQEGAGNYGLKARVAGTATMLGSDFVRHDINSNRSLFTDSQSEKLAETRSKIVSKMTPEQAKGFVELQEKNDQITKSYNAQQKQLIDNELIANGLQPHSSSVDTNFDMNFDNPAELSQQKQAEDIKRAEIEKKVVNSKEYQDLGQKINEINDANDRIEQWVSDAEKQNGVYHPYDKAPSSVQKMADDMNFLSQKKAETAYQFSNRK